MGGADIGGWCGEKTVVRCVCLCVSSTFCLLFGVCLLFGLVLVWSCLLFVCLLSVVSHCRTCWRRFPVVLMQISFLVCGAFCLLFGVCLFLFGFFLFVVCFVCCLAFICSCLVCSCLLLVCLFIVRGLFLVCVGDGSPSCCGLLFVCFLSVVVHCQCCCWRVCLLSLVCFLSVLVMVPRHVVWIWRFSVCFVCCWVCLLLWFVGWWRLPVALLVSGGFPPYGCVCCCGLLIGGGTCRVVGWWWFPAVLMVSCCV